MADFEAEIELIAKGEGNRNRRDGGQKKGDEKKDGTSRGAAAGGFLGAILGEMASSLNNLLKPLDAILTFLTVALFPIFKAFLILFLKVGVLLFRFLQMVLGGKGGPAESIGGSAGLSEEEKTRIREEGKQKGASEEQIEQNVKKADDLEKKKNKTLGVIGLVLGAIVSVAAALIAGFASIPALIISALLGGILGLITIIFGRDVAEFAISFFADVFTNLKEAFLNFPRNISKFFKVFLKGLEKSFKILVDFGKWIYDNVTKFISSTFEKLKDFGTWLFDGVTNIISTSLDALKGLGDWIYNAITNVVDSVLGSIGGVAGAVGDFIGVGDAVITPRGDVVKTDPNDFLIATKTPQDLGRGADRGSVNVTVNGGMITEDVARDIGQIIQRELNFGGGF